MNQITLLGKSTNKGVYAIGEKPLRMHQYVKINDRITGSFIGQVIEVYSFNSKEALKNVLPEIYTDIKTQTQKTIEVGYIQALTELEYPILLDSIVTEPTYEDMKGLFQPLKEKEAWFLGIVKGTEGLSLKLPIHYRNKVFELKEQKIMETEAMPFAFPFYRMKEYPHIGLFGGSGSGKTFALRSICEEMMAKEIPAIVFDPHYELTFHTDMQGYQHGENFSSKHLILEVGKDIGIPFTELTTDDLLSLLEFVGELSQPMRAAFYELHERKDTFSSLSNRIRSLHQAFSNYEKPKRERDVISDEEVLLFERFKNKIAGSTTLQAISWRLEQLSRTGIFDHDISALEKGMLGRKMVVVQGRVKHLRMIASYIVQQAYYKRRKYQDAKQRNQHAEPFPPFFLVMDESHVFAPNHKNVNPTTRILVEIAQEARKYGVYMVLATQRPYLLNSTIVSQLNTKIIFRTSIQSDMEMIQAETNLTEEQMNNLPSLTSGHAYVSSAVLAETFYIKFRATKTTSPHENHPFDELESFGQTKNKELRKAIQHYLPIRVEEIPSILQNLSILCTVEDFQRELQAMAREGEITEERSPFGSMYR